MSTLPSSLESFWKLISEGLLLVIGGKKKKKKKE
jgi:hypothetical protein